MGNILRKFQASFNLPLFLLSLFLLFLGFVFNWETALHHLAYLPFPFPLACQAVVYDALQHKQYDTMISLYKKSSCRSVANLAGYFSYAFYQQDDLSQAYALAKSITANDPDTLRWHKALVAFDTRHYTEAEKAACLLTTRSAKDLCSILHQLLPVQKHFSLLNNRFSLYTHENISTEDAYALLALMQEKEKELRSVLSLPPTSGITGWVMPDALFEKILEVKGVEALSINSHLFLKHPRDLSRLHSLPTTLVHELVHTLLYIHFHAPIPNWVNEGLAQVLSNEPFNEEERRAFLQARASFSLYSLKELSEPWQGRKLNLKLAYAESRLAVQYLVDLYGYAEVVKYLHLLTIADDPENALFSVFGFRYAALEESLQG